MTSERRKLSFFLLLQPVILTFTSAILLEELQIHSWMWSALPPQYLQRISHTQYLQISHPQLFIWCGIFCKYFDTTQHPEQGSVVMWVPSNSEYSVILRRWASLFDWCRGSSATEVPLPVEGPLKSDHFFTASHQFRTLWMRQNQCKIWLPLEISLPSL